MIKLFVRILVGLLVIFASTGVTMAFDDKEAIESLRQNKDLNYIFDTNALPTVTIEVAANEWNKQLIYFDANPRHEEYVKANFIFEKEGKTERLDNIGFRIKGGQFSRKRPEGFVRIFHDSANPKWHKAHFTLNFQKYKKKQRFRGLEGMNVRFIKEDPMYVRELYGYDLAKRYGIWLMNYASLAKLYIKVGGDAKPAYFGIYNISEKIGKEFLNRRFKDRGQDEHQKGSLWKNLWTEVGESADLRPESFNPETVGEEKISLNEKDSFRPIYSLQYSKAGLEKASGQYRQFIQNLNTKTGDDFVTWIESAFDVDQFLKTIALYTLLGNWDNYWVSANNYYLYFNEAGRAYYIPYDFDNDLGTTVYYDNIGTQDIMTFGPMNSSRPLVFNILKIQKFRDKFKTYIEELITPSNNLFSFSASSARIMKWQDLIKNHVIDDTGEMTKLEDRTAPWSQTPFYRLLSGNDRGVAPEANWFRTRSVFAMEQIKADKGWKKPVTPQNTELFLKGQFNKWSSNGAYRFTYGNGIYTLNIHLTKNTSYKFVIADKEMKAITHFGASLQDQIVRVGEPIQLYRKVTNPVLTDIQLNTNETGTYKFVLNVTDDENPELAVNLVSIESPGNAGAK